MNQFLSLPVLSFTTVHGTLKGLTMIVFLPQVSYVKMARRLSKQFRFSNTGLSWENIGQCARGPFSGWRGKAPQVVTLKHCLQFGQVTELAPLPNWAVPKQSRCSLQTRRTDSSPRVRNGIDPYSVSLSCLCWMGSCSGEVRASVRIMTVSSSFKTGAHEHLFTS